MKWLRDNLVAGALVFVPIIFTIWILKVIVITADEFFINLLPRQLHPEMLLGKDIPGVGIVVTLTLMILTGFFTRLYIGKKVLQIGDALIAKIPLGRSIYSGVKQFLHTVVSRDPNKFKTVVVVEYPRKDIFALGFVTSDPIPLLQAIDKRRWVNVFIPTTPNPTSGFLVMVPEEDVRPLNIPIEYAFKLIISGGIVRSETSNHGRENHHEK